MKPTIEELKHLCRAVKLTIEDDFRAFEGDDQPGIQLTVAANKNGDWDYQTGDNSYSGPVYHYRCWAVVGVYRNSNCLELARDIRNQLADLMY
jgi:hypothetical protein